MDSFNQTTGFRYNLNSNTIADSNRDEGEFSGMLEIYVHHARNIHNICIYENQDVYAKFSLTYNPDDTLSTRIINGGGKNPEFNENLRMNITQIDAVLKCEIWMLSRARNYMEDQLLGFALVPISTVAGKGKVTQNYSLSSTDLFHSPAGTVKLTLSLNALLPIDPSSSLSESFSKSSISSEVVLLDPVEYSSSVEFPDISIARENQRMVSEYFNSGIASFLRLGSSPTPIDDYEMTANSSDEIQTENPLSPNESVKNSGFLSSTTTSLSDDRKTTSEGANQNPGASPGTPTSKKEGESSRDEKDSNFSSGEEEKNEKKISSVKFDKVFTAPLGNINVQAEQSAMQQQIVDMYMRSMQQFTESLAKMKLPMDLDKPQGEGEDSGVVIQNHDNQPEIDKKKKDGSRVFYGSRAFF